MLLKEPTHLEHDKEIRNIVSCCFGDYSVQVSLDIKKSGLIPGEPLEYDIKINNKSYNRLNKLKLELSQIITYKAYGPDDRKELFPHYLRKKDNLRDVFYEY